MENLFENISKIELISYFSSEILCIVGILINIVMFLFCSKKYNIKRLSDITTFSIFTLNSMITLGIYLNFQNSDFSIFNNLIVFNSQALLLKLLVYIFLALFVLTTYRTTRKAHFKMTLVNSCLLFLAIASTLLIQIENKILAFLFLDVCSFFIYKFASNIRIRKPSAYCVDFILISSAATILFYLFYGLTYLIKQELQLAIIQVCMICALFLKAGLFPIYNYSLTKKAKNNLAYGLLLFNFLPFLGIIAFLKYYQSVDFSNEIYFIITVSLVLLVMLTSAICAFQAKNLIKYFANLAYVGFSLYIVAILFSQDLNLIVNKVAIFMYGIFALYSLLAILKINFKSERLNLALLSGLFVKNRLFSSIFAFSLLIMVNVVPSMVLINNFETIKEIYKFDKSGFIVVVTFIFSSALVLLNALRIIKTIYTKTDLNPIKKLTKRTTLNYVVPCVIILVLIVGMFL